jgi:gliding motility-associated-like protein
VNRCDSGYVRFVNKTDDVQNLSGQYTWYFGDGTTSQVQDPVHVYSQPGSYNVKLKLNTSLFCLADSMTQTVDISSFQITVSPEQTIMVGQSVQIFANGNASSYQWLPPKGLNDTDIPDPVASPLEDMVYKVIATDSSGCTSEDSVKIKVIQFNDFYVPTAFSPNNDGKNDLMRPFFPGKYSLIEFSVFNRWGEKIFSTSTRGEGWNGYYKSKLQPQDVYVWIIRAVHDYQKPVEIKGSFVLIR